MLYPSAFKFKVRSKQTCSLSLLRISKKLVQGGMISTTLWNLTIQIKPQAVELFLCLTTLLSATFVKFLNEGRSKLRLIDTLRKGRNNILTTSPQPKRLAREVTPLIDLPDVFINEDFSFSFFTRSVM